METALCPKCKETVNLIEKMQCYICEKCRIIVRYKSYTLVNDLRTMDVSTRQKVCEKLYDDNHVLMPGSAFRNLIKEVKENG